MQKSVARKGVRENSSGRVHHTFMKLSVGMLEVSRDESALYLPPDTRNHGEQE